MTDELLAARDAYLKVFGDEGPYPFGVDDQAIARELRAAVARGTPIDPDFNWWSDVPPDAVA